jgi:hypothetical protein
MHQYHLGLGGARTVPARLSWLRRGAARSRRYVWSVSVQLDMEPLTPISRSIADATIIPCIRRPENVCAALLSFLSLPLSCFTCARRIRWDRFRRVLFIATMAMNELASMTVRRRRRRRRCTGGGPAAKRCRVFRRRAKSQAVRRWDLWGARSIDGNRLP